MSEKKQKKQTKAQREVLQDEWVKAGFKMIDWNKWAYTNEADDLSPFTVGPGVSGLQTGLVAKGEDMEFFFPYKTAPAVIAAQLKMAVN